MEDKFHMTLDENLFLAKKILVENIYNTAKLEGVNTTFPETEAILEGINVPNAKLDDIQVILNLRDAWRDVLADVKSEVINLEFIKKINGSVSRNESLKWGELRSGNIGISGTNHKPDVPAEAEVTERVDQILGDVTKSPTERAIDISLYIMYSQLFWDGNKRTANLVANAVLIQNGSGVLSVPTDEIAEFNRRLTNYYDTGNDEAIKKFMYTKAVIDFETKNVPVNVLVNVPVNPTEQLVLDEISQNPAVTYEELAQKVGKTRKTVSRAVASLKGRGLIVRRGSDKTGYWVV